MSTLRDVTSDALALTAEERVLLAQRVWDSMGHFSNPEIEAAWMAEADRRWQEIEAGTVKCVSADDVMKRAREGRKT